MTLAAVAQALAAPGLRLVSSDAFDTVLLRDGSTETMRLAAAARAAAAVLGVDERVLTRLRWWAHEDGYRGVDVDDATAEARLSAMCEVVAAALGLDSAAAAVLERAEADVDVAHLRPNLALLALLRQAEDSGLRVIALSDTWYSSSQLRWILNRVLGAHPFAEVYTSADLQLTKHTGTAFATIADIEGVAGDAILHVGDNPLADVSRPTAAGWRAVHLARTNPARERIPGRLRSLPDRFRRWQ